MNQLTRSAVVFSLTLLGAAGAFANEEHDHAQHTQSAETTAKTCVVSGEKLGEMGEPVRYVYKEAGKPDRVIQFCCKDCIKDFEKEPAKYLAKLDSRAAEKPSDAAAAKDTCCEILEHYVPISEALAADDLTKAKASAAAFAKQADTDGMGAIADLARAIANAGSIAAARDTFKKLSKEVEPMADSTKGYVVMNCPMARADWVQTDSKVRNPYYGKAMLTCGAPKK